MSGRAWLRAGAMAWGVSLGALLLPLPVSAQVDPATVPEAKRTRAEAMYVGMAESVDALVPYVELQELMTDWDEPRRAYRSSRGANRLAEEGYTRVYSVVDGFEGDLSKDGRRSVNGWKNAGLPWSYRLDKARMYFPR